MYVFLLGKEKTAGKNKALKNAPSGAFFNALFL